MTTTLLAVNGTLMRGLELNPNMQKAGVLKIGRASCRERV